ncbi:hypothetical protein IMZ48_16095 [Candidatus Bathyarchaeota archaeon]|nr:hypothetical protein [Candidatus Bathyarchaeota archaeon]
MRRLSVSLRRNGQAKRSEKGPELSPIPLTQTVLLLNEPRQDYQVVRNYPVPDLLGDDEVLVKTAAIGLNPIDWKAP